MRLVDELPGRAAIVRAIEAGRGRILDQGIHPIRIALRDRHGGLAERVVRGGQAVSGDLVP
jgi:hypothetical protein